jgi:hypothetical protein
VGGCFGRWFSIAVLLSVVCIALYYLTQ